MEQELKTFDFIKTPIVDIANDILYDGAILGASDIHFDPCEEYLKIRMRIDGDLRDYAHIKNENKRNLVTRLKIMSGMNITESRLPQDGAIKTNIKELDLDMRVSSLPTNKGEKIVIRILDYTRSSQGIEQLDFTESNLEKVKEMIKVPNGIILVTGATGSGKSTTVYSILQRLNREDINVMTVEDPIEMDIEGINQIQVNSEIGLTFASVLRSILRQDPNIVMIGEIRDTETAQIAIRASITGHLVLSTIHTNNSLNTIERLIDMGVERYLLGTALEGIISQKLARRLCPHCMQKRNTTNYEKALFKHVLDMDVDETYISKGCSECANIGYKGRISIQEVLIINEEIRDAITENIRKDALRKLVYGENGTTTLLQDGLLKVVEGKTTIEEILKLVEVDESEINLNDIQTTKNDESETNLNNIQTIKNDENEINSNNIQTIKNDESEISSNNIQTIENDESDISNSDRDTNIVDKSYDTNMLIDDNKDSIDISNYSIPQINVIKDDISVIDNTDEVIDF